MKHQLPAAAAPEAGSEARTGDFDAASIGKILIEIVAEKSGYPLDYLDLGMNIEADLGIDSIKRVEIVSLLRRRTGIAAAAAKRLAKGRRLEDVVALALEAIDDPASPQVSLVPDPGLSTGPRPAQLAMNGVGLVALPAPRAGVVRAGGVVVVHGDGTSATSALIERLCALELVPVVLSIPSVLASALALPDDVHQVVLAKAGEADLSAALARIARSLGAIDAVIHLQPAQASEAQHRVLLQQALLLAKHCAADPTDCAPRAGVGAFFGVTRLDGCLATAGDRGTLPLAAGIAGLVRTLALESPLLRTRSVDVDPQASQRNGWSGRARAVLRATTRSPSAGATACDAPWPGRRSDRRQACLAGTR